MVPWSDSRRSAHGRTDTMIEHQPLPVSNQCSEQGELRGRTVSTVLLAMGACMPDATNGVLEWCHGVTLEGVHAREKALCSRRSPLIGKTPCCFTGVRPSLRGACKSR